MYRVIRKYSIDNKNYLNSCSLWHLLESKTHNITKRTQTPCEIDTFNRYCVRHLTDITFNRYCESKRANAVLMLRELIARTTWATNKRKPLEQHTRPPLKLMPRNTAMRERERSSEPHQYSGSTNTHTHSRHMRTRIRWTQKPREHPL